MKNLSLIIALLLALSSCRSVNKSLVKTSEKEKTELQATNSSSAAAASTTSSNATYTTTREFEDNAEVPPVVITGSVSADQVNHGQVAHIETAAGGIDIKTDPTTGVITATATTKAQKVPVKGKETTIGAINTVSTASTSSASASAINFKSQKETSSKQKDVRRKSNTLLWVIIGHVITGGAVFIIWWIRRKKKEKQASSDG